MATIRQMYHDVLTALEELDSVRPRLLGRADALRSLIDAGLGSLEVPEASESPQEPSLNGAGGQESREPISAL